MRRKSPALVVLLLTVLCAPLSALEGHLTVLWGDPAPDSDEQTVLEITLVGADGSSRPVAVEPAALAAAGGLARVAGRSVRVEGVEDSLGALTLTSIETVEQQGGITGSKPWVSLACKFLDVGAEPENLAYFTGMYANTTGRLDHYWREVSYDLIDVAGSTAVDWVTLPNNHTVYVPTPGSGTSANLSALFNDCTAAADPFIDFSLGGTGGFEGINLMFNEVLDCCAWGGSRFATLDGVAKSWRTTWNPPWAFHQEAVIAHEMGHGFGLPHANNSDGDSDPYDSPWDVMSSATGYAVDDPVYGNLGKHVTTYHKDVLGWIAPAEYFIVQGDGSWAVDVDPLGRATTTNHRAIKVPIEGSSRYYIVEVREAVGDYEADIPGNGPGDKVVILHQVVPGNSTPAQVLDADVPPADYSDTEGVMWRVGEVFVDPANQIVIEIEAATVTGFRVRVSVGGALFADGFESGDTGAWDTTVP